MSINPVPNTLHNIRCATSSLRYVRHTSAALSDLVTHKHINSLAITETRFSRKDTGSCLADITPPGVSLHHNHRLSGRGGGVAFIVSDMFSVEVFQLPQFQSFETLCILVRN